MQLHVETSDPNCAEQIRAMADLSDVMVTLTAADEDVIQMAGIHETVFLYLENQSWVLVGGAALGVLGSEIIKDLYNTIKSISVSLFKGFKPKSEEHGIELLVAPKGRHTKGLAGTPNEIVRLTYSGRCNAKGAYVFDENQIEHAFNTYETVISPLISYWRLNASVTSVYAHAFFGPGEEHPKWDLIICGRDGRALVYTSVDIRR